MRAGVFVSIENPFRSWLWAMPSVAAIGRQPGFGYTFLRFSDFGAAWAKPTAILHNNPCLHELVCGGPRPEVPSVVLHGLVMWHGAPVFKTALACPYPVQLCQEFGRLFRKSLGVRACALSLKRHLSYMSPAVNMGNPLESSWLHGDCGRAGPSAMRRTR